MSSRISAPEAARRRDSVLQAEVSNRLEGGVMSHERALLNDRYVAGEIDLDTYVHLGLELARRRVRTVAPG